MRLPEDFEDEAEAKSLDTSCSACGGRQDAEDETMKDTGAETMLGLYGADPIIERCVDRIHRT